MPKTRSIRFPTELDERIAAAAKKDRRTYSTWVMLACETMLARNWTWTLTTGATNTAPPIHYTVAESTQPEPRKKR